MTEAPPAGWYTDPHGGERLRWWDGDKWTEQMQAPALAATEAAGEPQSEDTRRSILSSRVHYYVSHGYRVDSQTDFQAVVVTGRRPNHLLHLILTIITLGLWGIVWLILALASGEKRKAISVDGYGRAIET